MNARIALLSFLVAACQAHIHSEPWRPATAASGEDFVAQTAPAPTAIPELPEAAPEAAPEAVIVASPAAPAAHAHAEAVPPGARAAAPARSRRSPTTVAAPPPPRPAPVAAPPPAAVVDAAADADAGKAEARSIFGARCSVCHGASGQGNGPAGAALNPHPRDFTNAAWHATISDGRIEQTILRGGAAMGKSPLMPANPDLADKPHVLRSLRAIVRGFRR